MTPQEAIDVIKIAISEVEWNYPMSYAAAFETAVEALEKQIPNKPLDVVEEYDGDYGRCPSCNRMASDFHDFKFCRSCGQALDWSDKNND